MTPKSDVDKLRALFERLDAPDPDSWVSSQVDEGIPQLARLAFLRDAWSLVLTDQDHSWIDRQIEHADRKPSAPFAGIGQALSRIRASGAADEDLTELVRGMEASLLFSLLYLLGDPGEAAQSVGVSWALFELSPDDEVLGEISGLHESVLETDPTGREMRPR